MMLNEKDILNQNKENPFETFPPELITYIFSFLDAKDLCNIETVAKAWRRLLIEQSNFLWKPIIGRKGMRALENSDYKTTYAKLIQFKNNSTERNYKQDFINKNPNTSELEDYELILMNYKVLSNFSAEDFICIVGIFLRSGRFESFLNFYNDVVTYLGGCENKIVLDITDSKIQVESLEDLEKGITSNALNSKQQINKLKTIKYVFKETVSYIQQLKKDLFDNNDKDPFVVLENLISKLKEGKKKYISYRILGVRYLKLHAAELGISEKIDSYVEQQVKAIKQGVVNGVVNRYPFPRPNFIFYLSCINFFFMCAGNLITGNYKNSYFYFYASLLVFFAFLTHAIALCLDIYKVLKDRENDFEAHQLGQMANELLENSFNNSNQTLFSPERVALTSWNLSSTSSSDDNRESSFCDANKKLQINDIESMIQEHSAADNLRRRVSSIENGDSTFGNTPVNSSSNNNEIFSDRDEESQSLIKMHPQ